MLLQDLTYRHTAHTFPQKYTQSTHIKKHTKTYTHTRTHAHTPHTPKQLHLQNTINRKTDLFEGFL